MSETTPTRWYALVTFVSETPTDDMAADDHADKLSEAIEGAIGGLSEVDTHTAAVRDIDSMRLGFDVADYSAVSVVRHG